MRNKPPNIDMDKSLRHKLPLGSGESGENEDLGSKSSDYKGAELS